MRVVHARVRVIGAGVLASAALVAHTAVARTGAAGAAGCKREAGAQTMVTSSYRFKLRVGPSEKMYTPAQVRRLHPKTGEVMLRGTMMAMGHMSMGESMRHLEVQICARGTSAVLTHARPTIVVVDEMMHKTTQVPIAVMEGIGEGVADLHYGNNVPMRPGDRYTIRVGLKHQRAVFHLTLPKTM
jgi:hypothetical protein